MACSAPSSLEDTRLDHPPSPQHFGRQSSPTSPSTSSDTPSEASDGGDSDSDDEDGVFLGSHQLKETVLVAKLSSTISTPTRPIVRKRDSREFLRRQTLLLSARKANTAPSTAKKEDSEKEWSGGFYVKGARPRAVEADFDSEDEEATPLFAFRDVASPSEPDAEHCDLTFDFANFRLHDAASPLVQHTTHRTDRRTSHQVKDSESSGEDEDDDTYDDSDKENNVALVSPVSTRSDRLPLEEQPDFLFVLGKEAEPYEEDDDSLRELNMGGLRLTDFSDPESANGDEPRYNESAVDLGFSSEEEEERLDGEIDSAMHDEMSAAAADTEVGGRQEQAEQACEAISPSASDPISEAEDSPNTSPKASPGAITHSPPPSPTLAGAAGIYSTPPAGVLGVTPRSRCTESLETSASVSDIDSPLPVARAPDVIPHLPPHLARSIRAESGSPYRALPPSIPHDIRPESGDDTALALPALTGSPVIVAAAPSASAAVHPGELLATPYLQRSTLHAIASGGKAKSALPFRVPASAGPSKTLARSVRAEKKVAARVGNIKSQLDTVFVNRLGPPQRSASGASSTSSTLGPSTQSRPLGMSVSLSAPSRTSRPVDTKLIEQARPASASTSSRSAPFASSAQNPPRTAKAPLATSTSAPHKIVTVPKPFTASSRASVRQPLAPRMVPPRSQPVRSAKVLGKPTLHRPGVVGGRPAAASISGSTAPSPPQAAQNPLKRPLSTSQPTLGRAVISTTLTHPINRPALALPARAAMTQSSTQAILPDSETAGALRTVLQSPPHLGVPKTAGTPRRLGTPMRLVTPGRARSVATPLGKSSLNHSSPVRPSAALLLGTPGRPTRLGRGGEAIHPAPITTSVPEVTISSTNQAQFGFAQAQSSIADDVKERPRQAAAQETDTAPERGSSVEYADVSMSLAPKSSSPPMQDTAREASTESTTPPGSPTKLAKSKAASPSKPSPKRKDSPEPAISGPEPRRPKRSIRPPTAALKTATKPKPPSTNTSEFLPGISEKELRAATQRNTDKNTVYLYCTIDRQIVRQPGPRPPSPTSKIRITADRVEEEKKAGRGERAQRRSARESTGTNGDDSAQVDINSHKSNIERVERARGPGDDDDYATPARPSKKIKTKHARRVGWDRELVIIRDDGRPHTERAGSGPAAKSALRADQVELDRFGNVVHVSANGGGKEAIKKQKIPVTAVFYEGEDPMPFEPPYITSNQEKAKAKPASKGRKK